jgi:hypothetical protein
MSSLKSLVPRYTDARRFPDKISAGGTAYKVDVESLDRRVRAGKNISADPETWDYIRVR